MNLLLTKDEAWKIYQSNGGRGVPPRDQVHSVARAQLKGGRESREYQIRINNILLTEGNILNYALRDRISDQILALLEE